MMANMREDAEAGRPSDMVSYLNWITFDIVGDLSFSQSFDALKTRTTHPWIAGFFGSLKIGAILSELASIPAFRPLLLALVIPVRMSKRNKVLRSYCGEKIEKRIEMGKLDRPDFLSKVLAQNEKNDENSNLSMAEINATFNILMIAGSETTATVLAGCIFLLQKNLEVLNKLKDEVRGAFANEDEITVTNVNKLPYLLAVLEESLRHYPPVPVSLPRVAPPAGATVCGLYVPGGVSKSLDFHTKQQLTRL
jgi:cytochrome P450